MKIEGRVYINPMGVIFLRMPIENIPAVVEGAWASGAVKSRFKVIDANAFAQELCRILNEESEDGTTLVHKMFDAAINRAIEYGAEGIELHERQEA